MPGYWILKTEPSTYSFDQLEEEGRTRWDGISNAQALIHLRSMRPGDQALVYHSGAEKAIVGRARIASAAYPDPGGTDPRLVVVDVEAGRRLKRAVPLADIKADPAFAQLALVRQPRLSVVPVAAEQWKRLLALAT